MTRFFDCFLAIIGLLFCWPILLVVLLIAFFVGGSPIFCQKRVGIYRKPFILIKFRTMKLETLSVASHLVDASNVTPLGRFLRRTKIDELPQLFNVLKGEMSLVGPRPCLLSQGELIDLRELHSLFNVRPGITGLAQIRGIDMSTIDLLVKTELEMVKNLNLKSYFMIIFLTVMGKGAGDKVKAN